MLTIRELVDTETDETRAIQPMTQAEAKERNAGFRRLGEPYRWILHTPEDER